VGALSAALNGAILMLVVICMAVMPLASSMVTGTLSACSIRCATRAAVYTSEQVDEQYRELVAAGCRVVSVSEAITGALNQRLASGGRESRTNPLKVVRPRVFTRISSPKGGNGTPCRPPAASES